MKFKIIVHKAEEGGFWGEVSGLPGCFSQGETVPELLANMREAIECHLDAPVPAPSAELEVREVEV